MPAVKLEGKERPGFLSKHPQRVEYLWSVDTLGLGIVEIPISGADPESDKPWVSQQCCPGSRDMSNLLPRCAPSLCSLLQNWELGFECFQSVSLRAAKLKYLCGWKLTAWSAGVEMLLVLGCFYVCILVISGWVFTIRGWIFLRSMSETHQKFGPWMFQENVFVAWW